MSTINTNGLDVNYPVPGTNNSSQGFRNNFQNIKQNLDIASNEITDLQGKVVLKAALDNSTLNNNMANALISNAAVKGFRHPTYNLGGALSGTVAIDVSVADVQYGNIASNVQLQFTGWANATTLSSVTLQFGISNTQAVISFPSNVVSTNNNFGTTLLENFEITANVATITSSANVSQLNFKLSTTDCGNTIYIEPLNRPYQTTQIQQRTPTQIGSQGDKAGTVATDTSYFYVCTGDYDGSSNIWTRVSLSW